MQKYFDVWNLKLLLTSLGFEDYLQHAHNKMTKEFVLEL